MRCLRIPNACRAIIWLVLANSLLGTSVARADVVTDWNLRDGELIAAANLNTPEANRVMAIAHTAAYEAANAITRRFPGAGSGLHPGSGASLDAAIAAAHHAVLLALVPAQGATIDQVYQTALGALADDAPRSMGIAVGEEAATMVLARRADDTASAAAHEAYRSHAGAGIYVPTTTPIASQWPQRTPWLMTSVAQFRPGPPPDLSGRLWARDYNEVKSLGSREGSSRSAEQTAIARFWEATLPSIYHGLVRSVAGLPGRDVTQNARLFAAVTQAVDDALIAVFDAKYHYGFWRPITAIRSGDIDGNDATVADSSWLPFVDTPMHPEYPCAHCIVAAAVGTVLRAEIGAGPAPLLSTSSTTAHGAVRTWSSVEDFMQEVANARIYDGVHFRNSTEVGTAMGRKIGALAVDRFLHQ